MEGPDFICVGMQKAGTGWLYDQLARHPDFWMPPLKEIHYLHRDKPGLGNARRWQRKLRKKGRRGEPLRSWRRTMEERDLAFLAELTALRGQTRDVAKYAALFRFKGDKRSGDVSPSYSGMTDAAVREVALQLPGVRIVQLVRDPVTRLWSQLNMALRKDKLDAATLSDPAKLSAHLAERDDLDKVSFPSHAARRWRALAPDVAFKAFFYDDLVERPDALRREILVHLGADPDAGDGVPGDNRKSKNAKLALAPDVETVLAAFFRDELHACAETFGGPARNWIARYFP